MKNDKRQDDARRGLKNYERDTEASRAHLVNVINGVTREELDTFLDEPGASSNAVVVAIENFLDRAQSRGSHARMVELIMNRLGWTQKDLAERMDVHAYSVSRWTRGENAPKDRVWIELFRTLIRENLIDAVDGPDLLVAFVDGDIEKVRSLLPTKVEGGEE